MAFKDVAFKPEPWWDGGVNAKESEETVDLPFTKLICIYLSGFFTSVLGTAIG